MSVENIDSILQEERLFPPPATFSEQAGINSEDALNQLRRQSQEDYTGFWAELARREIDWQTPFTNILDERNAPHYQWFNDGRLNVSYNCLDRHLAQRGDQTAIIFEGEKGDTQTLTYRALHA